MKIPETRAEWITYGKTKCPLLKAKITVFELSSKHNLLDYSYQAEDLLKFTPKTLLNPEILVSNSLIALKKEVKRRRWRIALISSTKEFTLHYRGLDVEYIYYRPKYRI